MLENEEKDQNVFNPNQLLRGLPLKLELLSFISKLTFGKV